MLHLKQTNRLASLSMAERLQEQTQAAMLKAKEEAMVGMQKGMAGMQAGMQMGVSGMQKGMQLGMRGIGSLTGKVCIQGARFAGKERLCCSSQQRAFFNTVQQSGSR